MSEPTKGYSLFLRFETAFHCKVYLNGQLLAETMEHFLPIESGIADLACYGQEMSYPGGRIYLEFDRPVTARCFAAELTEDATKEWLMSDVTLLG